MKATYKLINPQVVNNAVEAVRNAPTGHKDCNCSKVCDNCGSIYFRDKRNTWSYWARTRFCSRSCSNIKTTQEKIARRPSIEESFWSYVVKGAENDCWVWNGLKDRQGYALLSYDQKMHRATRLAIIFAGRGIPKGYFACHSCGNPACINPSHIYAGSPSQNNKDKILHGTQPMGSDVYCAKLKESDVLDIRKDHRSYSAIAKDYGVSRSNITAIKNRKTWRHL